MPLGGSARQAALQADGDVARLIGGDPVGRLDLALPHHRPGLHGGVDLVAGAVEEAGVDEDDPVLHRMDAGRQIGRGAPLLVHHTDLDRVPRQTQQVLDRVEQGVGEGALLGPVHLGFDDIDRPLPGCSGTAPAPFRSCIGDQRGDDGVQHPFGRVRPVGQPHRRRGHQMADVAHEQQRPARQGHRRSVRRGERSDPAPAPASSTVRPCRTSRSARPSSGPASCGRRRSCRRRRRPRRSPPDRRWCSAPTPARRRKSPPDRWRRSDGPDRTRPRYAARCDGTAATARCGPTYWAPDRGSRCLP
jgi:hypothetical protein